MTKQNLPTRVSEQRQTVVDAVLNTISTNGVLPFLQEWAAGAMPTSLASGKAYRGVNRLNLKFIGKYMGFSDPRWMTFKAAQRAGYKVQKGAHSAVVEKWKTRTIIKDSQNPDEEPQIFTLISCVGYYSVFNAEQIDGVPEYDPGYVDLAQNQILDIADKLAASSRCAVVEDAEGRAYYSPLQDLVHMPDRRLFLGSDENRSQNFIRTLAHEMTHSTMKPLNRSVEGSFGSEPYAKEELCAELGSMFICSDLHIPASYVDGDEHYMQHAAYLQNWISAVSHDDAASALYNAATRADEAARYIIDRYNLMYN